MGVNVRISVLMMMVFRKVMRMIMNIRMGGVMLAMKLVRRGIMEMIKFRRRVMWLVIIMGFRGRIMVMVRIYIGGTMMRKVGFSVRRMVLNIWKGGMM